MPRFRRESTLAPLADTSAWLPQAFGRVSFREVTDPIVEPSWSGVRVLARAERGVSGAMAAALADETGEDCTDEFAAVARAIAEALRADDAILDGYLTAEPTQSSTGVIPDGPRAPTPSDMATQLLLGQRRSRRPEEKKPRPSPDQDRSIAFVAVDLLRIDGSNLVGLPLLERKRLLEGALETGDLVRVTPFVRLPVGSQAQTWFAQGFREMVYKPANGRYRPTGEPGDWATGPIRSS